MNRAMVNCSVHCSVLLSSLVSHRFLISFLYRLKKDRTPFLRFFGIFRSPCMHQPEGDSQGQKVLIIKSRRVEFNLSSDL